MYTRQSAWLNGGDFSNPTLFWYAKGVGILRQRPIADPTSWLFLAAIHGITNNLWIQLGYLDRNAALPTPTVQATYWNQCQHQSWYFLPWHRGYLLSLEAIVRDAIIKAGGPTDWALPYWNYSDENNPQARYIPPAFTQKTMPKDFNKPDTEQVPNPLYIEQRYGSMPVPAGDVALTALNTTFFTGSSTGGNPGFGGVQTTFSHFGNVNGGLESRPHNLIHGDVGGRFPGLMSNPNTASIDPIFYLHHANIDRLWPVWLDRGGGRTNPPDNSPWQTGPADRGFIVPMADGQGWKYTAKDVVSTTALGYNYDDTQDPFQGVSAVTSRLEQLGIPQNATPSFSISEESMGDEKRNAELIGANKSKIKLLGKSASTKVKLDKQMAKKTNLSFDISEADVQEPDHIYLNLENIRCKQDGNVIDVYVTLPSGAKSDDQSEVLAGSIALFGAANASQPDQPHGGIGVTEVLDITPVVDALHLAGSGLDELANLEVRLQPRFDATKDENITVERISVYREGK